MQERKLYEGGCEDEDYPTQEDEEIRAELDREDAGLDVEDERLPGWEEEAKDELLSAISSMVVSTKDKTVTIPGDIRQYDEVFESFQALVDHLVDMYKSAWDDNSPWDSGEPVFGCDYPKAELAVISALSDHIPIFEKMGWDVEIPEEEK